MCVLQLQTWNLAKLSIVPCIAISNLFLSMTEAGLFGHLSISFKLLYSGHSLTD